MHTEHKAQLPFQQVRWKPCIPCGFTIATQTAVSDPIALIVMQLSSESLDPARLHGSMLLQQELLWENLSSLPPKAP